jgi:hypothetical protein
VVVEKSPPLTMSAVSRCFQAHCSIRSEPSAISLSLRFAKPTLGSLLIVAGLEALSPTQPSLRSQPHIDATFRELSMRAGIALVTFQGDGRRLSEEHLRRLVS